MTIASLFLYVFFGILVCILYYSFSNFLFDVIHTFWQAIHVKTKKNGYSKKILLAKKVKTNFLKKYEGKTFEVGPILDKEILNYFPIKNQNKKIKTTIK